MLHRLLDDIAHLGDLVDAHEGVYFRQQFGQLLSKSLGQAARHDQALASIPGFPQLGRLQDGIDAFLLSRVDEGAGVDDEHIGLGGVVRELGPTLEERAEHDLGIHQVLGAPE